MKKLKQVLKIVLISVLSVVLLNTNAYAANVEITDENLNEALQRLVESEISGYGEIIVENNTIKMKDNQMEAEIKYDLTEDPTFTIEIPVQNGMTYDEYSMETEKIFFHAIPYVAIANIQGVDFETATMYFALACLNGASTLNPSGDAVTVVDDTAVSDGVTIEKTDDPNTFYVSEFPEKVMEYTNKVYKEKMIINDAEELNSFELTIEKQDETETSCKLVSTLTVNMDADFSKLNETDESGITKENADYVIELKVGQKCKIQSSEKLRGYAVQNSNCVEFSEDYSEITAIEPGITTGYLYLGEDEQKTIHITVTENTGNENLETITLKIENTTNEDSSNDNNSSTEKEDETSNDNEFVVTVPSDSNKEKDNTVVNTTTIPKAGLKNITFFIIIAFIVFLVAMGAKVRKYKGI